MIDILQFVFGSFWRWLGFAILLGITVNGLAVIAGACLRAWAGRRGA